MSSFTINNIIKLLYHEYEKSYLSSYGIDIIISIITIFIFLVLITYLWVLNHVPKLRSEWTSKRCNPIYMPFAHMVKKNSDVSPSISIQNNFNYCINNLLHTIANDALAPIYYAKHVASKTMEESLDAVHSIRAFFNNIRNDIANTSSNISGRTLNVMMPLMEMAITIKDSLSRIKGVYSSGIYFMMGTYLTMKSTIRFIIHMIVVVILITLVGIISGLIAIPFVGWGLATLPIALATAIMIPTVPIILKFNNIFKDNVSSDMPHW